MRTDELLRAQLYFFWSAGLGPRVVARMLDLPESFVQGAWLAWEHRRRMNENWESRLIAAFKDIP